MSIQNPSLVISCHADTGFRAHRLARKPGGIVRGQLDNFAGVHAVMTAYFSGKLDFPRVRIELTYGEESGMLGARELLESLDPRDTVVVVDVTAAPTDCAITIEKCRSPAMKEFVNRALAGTSYALFEGCPDPVAQSDESDVYRRKLANVFFLGIPCRGGDYNAHAVSCSDRSIAAASDALVRLAAAYNERACRAAGRKKRGRENGTDHNGPGRASICSLCRSCG